MGKFLNEFNISYSEYVQIVRSGLKSVTTFLKRAPHESMINNYKTDLLLLPEANMDIQYITDMYSCATYVLNYLNKSNAEMSKLLREADIEIKQGNKSMRDQLRLLANCFLNVSEFSAQEAVYYILALPLSSCSCQSEFINTNSPENRIAFLKKQSALKAMNPDSEGIFMKTSIDHYVARPPAMEDVCLADFVACYNYSTRKFRKGHNEESDNDTTDQGELHGAFTELIDYSGFIRKGQRAKVIRFVNYHENDEFDIQNQQNYIDQESGDEDTETPANLKIFGALSSQAAAVSNADIEFAVPNVKNEHEHTGYMTVLPVPRLFSEDEYSKIISSLNLKQRNYLQHVLYRFKENKLPFYHCVLGGAGVGKSRLIEAINQTVVRFLNKSSSSKNLESIKSILHAPNSDRHRRFFFFAL